MIKKRLANIDISERWLYILICLLAITVIAGFIFLFFIYDQPSSARTPFYVDNNACLQCHQPEAKAWLSSHHAMAMMRPNSTSVIGHFNNNSFRHDDVTSKFFKRDSHYYVNTQGPDGNYADFEMKYTFGIDPIQQYLIELPGGRLQNFTIAWDTHRQQWFDLYPHEKTPPGDVLHWAGRYQNANMMCVTCHTTDFKKNYNEKTDSYSSTWSQMNVNCQACHGPGSAHLDWAKKQSTASDPGKQHGLIVNFKQGGAQSVIDTCGICHSRRSELSSHNGVGEPLLDNYLPALLTEGLYYPDGQQQAEVYVYNSFRQSKMYQMGVSCVDCHNPHTGKIRLEGNAVCTQCHSPQGDKRFPSAAKLYDSPTHTFHPSGSSGAQCINCHMPAKNFMMIHARPDHSIRIPRPDLSIKLGTPNACTNCHTDKTATWANDWIVKWHGAKKDKKMHYGEVIAAGRKGETGAEQALIKLASDTSEPTVVRATALDLLSRYGETSINTSIAGLGATDPAIRRAALTGLEKLPPTERLTQTAPLLKDPVRAVRIEAARILSPLPSSSFNAEQGANFKVALNELIEAEKNAADMPGSNINLGVLYENMNQIETAEHYYMKALHIDPDFTPARLNLARIYSNTNRNSAAETMLREGLKRDPKQGDLYYSLGLLLAEDKNLPEAIEALKHAAELLPNQARVQYNYALALQQQGQRLKAESALLSAQQLEPQNSTFIYALTVFYAQDAAWIQAEKWANKLIELNPQDTQVKQFADEIRVKAARQ